MRRQNRRFLLTAIIVATCTVISLFFIAHKKKMADGHVLTVPCDCAQVENIEKNSLNLPRKVQGNDQLNSCHDLDRNSTILRAILIYYPDHQAADFFPEVRWLYRSWKETLMGQPNNWRTDFVIFSYGFSKELRSLGCVNRLRTNKEEKSMCRLFFYIPIRSRTSQITANNFEKGFEEAKRIMNALKEPDEPIITVPIVNDPTTFDSKRSDSLYANLKTYGYIDSINSIYEGYSTFKMYDFVLRTDIDVFLYRHFSNYIPTNCSFITGGGGYGTDFNRRKLRRISFDMGYAYANISGMGSTWYGTPHDAYVVANYTLDGMLWLAMYEFATPERESKLGTLMWPEWHYGVLLLYGQHLAINHLVGHNLLRVIIGHSLLDQSTTDNTKDYVQKGIRLNLHCWHTNERFSKFAFKLGQYKQSELNEYKNDTTARAYAMRMALESYYMTLEELAALGPNTN